MTCPRTLAIPPEIDAAPAQIRRLSEAVPVYAALDHDVCGIDM